eukprot:PITA_30914
MLYYKGRLYVPNQNSIKNLILDEFHKSHYAGHPGYQKLITALRKEYYWLGMKKEVAGYLARCIECQKIKAEHQHPVGLLQPLPIPEWNWETISMDFITGWPKSKKNNDSIMVVVDKLSKAAHFIPVQSTFRAIQITHVFMQNIFKLHGLPKTTISDRDVKFTSVFWKTLFEELGTQLEFSTAYHPQTNGQTERVNQVVEDMLRAYVMQQPTKSATPPQVGVDRKIEFLGPKMLKEMEELVKKVCYNLKVAQDRQKNFADRKRRFNEYQVESEGEIRVEPLSIIDRREVTLRKQDITQVKVQWQHFGLDEATWEDEELMRQAFPRLFTTGRHRDDV